MNLAKDYANELANSLTKITLTEFYQTVHDKFYPSHDISFRDYFLELTNHEGEFVVHHDKLVEYGIMTSTRSSAVKTKLDQLLLVENEDYRLQDILQPVKQGGFVNKKIYLLTPEAFKKCLMRARRYVNQKVDPTIYCNYYLLLEKIHKLYTDYERMYSEKLISMKDDKIPIKLKLNAIRLKLNPIKLSSCLVMQRILKKSSKVLVKILKILMSLSILCTILSLICMKLI